MDTPSQLPYPWQNKRTPTWPFGRQARPVRQRRDPIPFVPAPFLDHTGAP